LSLQKSAIDYRLTVRDAITPAQREKLRQLLRDRWRDGRGPSGAEGPGRGGPRGQGGAAPKPQAPPQSND